MRARRNIGRLALLVAAVATLQCGEIGPEVPAVGSVALVPIFNIEGAGVVPVAQVRLTILRSDSSTVALDTVVAIGADSVVELEVEIELDTDPEQFFIEMSVIGPSGNTVFRGGPDVVTVASTATDLTFEILIEYTGPGFDAASVGIEGDTVVASPGDNVTLVATAFDSAGNPIDGTPILWRSLDPTLLSVPNLEIGNVLAGQTPGDARVVASLLTGQSDTILIQIRPPIPIIALSTNAVQFAATTGGADPNSVVVPITNGGPPASVLNDLSLGTIAYGPPSGNWLTTANLSAAAAPATLTLQPSVGTLVPGTYTATVPIISSTANNSPQNITVTLDVANASAVTVTPTASALTVGDTLTFTAEALDAAGNQLTGLAFTWESMDVGVATVDATGLVTAVGAGATDITASSGTASGSATVTVEQTIALVTITPTTVSFGTIGDTLTLVAVARDANGNEVTGASFTWSSSDPTVVSVDQTGLITTIANTLPNTPVVITATTGTISGNAFITVITNAAGITVTPPSAQLNLGESVELTATVLDQTGQPDPNAVVTWASSSAVATVTSTSALTATVAASLSLSGFAEIIATSGNLSDTVSVTVLAPPVVTVTIEPAGSDTLSSVGDSLILTASARDAQGNPVTGLTFTWQSDLPAFATVTSIGPDQAVLIARASGTVTITAQTPAGDMGTKVVTVLQVPTNVSVTPASTTLTSLGATVLLNGVATDARGNPIPAIWTSLNPTVAIVNASGTVTAVGNGTATIELDAFGVKATASVTVQQTPAAVQITPPSATTAAIGDTVVLTARALDALGNQVPSIAATWASGNPTSVSVVSTSDTTATATALAVATVTVSATMGQATGIATIGVGQIPDAASSIASVGASAAAGLPTNIVVQSRDLSGANLTAGGATVAVTVTGANPIGSLIVTDSANGRYGAQYIPTAIGTNTIAITLNGTPIGGSPFTTQVNPGPPDATTSTVAVPAGVSGVPTTIGIQARDQFAHDLTTGGAAVTATLTAGSANAGTTVSVADNGDGTYSAVYTPTVTGTDGMQLTINSIAIAGSPFLSAVAPGAVNGATSTALVPEQTTAGLPATVVVQGRDANGNPVSVGGASVVGTIVSGLNIGAAITVVDSSTVGGKPGVYTITYVPSSAGTDQINITLNGTPIAGTQPFAVVVIAGGASGANSTASFTPDVTSLPPFVQAGTPVRLRVQARDINGNIVSTGGDLMVVDFFDGPNAPQPPTPNPLGGLDNGNGTYDYFYTPTAATPLGAGVVDSIAVTLNGVPIIGSPFGVHTIPSTMVPSQATVTLNNDYTVAPIVAGTNVTFTVQGRDQFGNAVRIGGGSLAGSVTGANGPLDLNKGINDQGNGTYTASYVPTIAGPDVVSLTLDGVTVPGSPFTGTIIPDFGDFAVSTATFNPGSPLIAGTPSSITVTARDMFGNITPDAAVVVEVVGLNALGPSSATDNGDGTHTFAFPTQSGGPEVATVGIADTILVVLDGGQGPGSVGLVGGNTIPLDVLPGPFDVAASSVNIAPDFTVSPVEAGTAVDLTITLRDQFGNQLQSGGTNIGVVVSGANAIDLSSSVVDNGDGTYYVTHQPTIAGNDVISVTLNGSSAVGSPFSGIVIPGPAASITVTPNSAIMTVGSGTQPFTVSALDIYENPVTSPVSWASLNPTIVSVTSGGIAGSTGGTGQATVSATVDGIAGYALITMTDLTPVNPPQVSWAPEVHTTESMRGIWGTEQNSVTVVGHNGTILHWDGINVVTERTGTGELLEGVWGSSDNDVFAVGAGVVLHNDGTGWVVQENLAPNLYGVWGSSPDDVWAVGDDGNPLNGVLYHYDGVSWTAQSSGTQRLNGIWGSSATDIYAVGNGGAIIHYDGGSWSPAGSITSNDLFGVWGTQPGNVYAVGASITVLRFDGFVWSFESVSAETDFFGIWGSSDENIFISGIFGELHRKDAQGWSGISSGTFEDLVHIWGSAPDDVIVVGDNGTIINSSEASPATSGVTASPNSILADGVSTTIVQVTLSDAFENPLNNGGDFVTISASAGTLGPVIDNDDGTYTATLTAPSTFGTATVTAMVNGLPIQSSTVVTFTLPSFTDGQGVTHWYEVIPAGSPSINWTDAKAAAAARNYFGNPGHLVTILTASEAAFIQANLSLPQQTWIGLADEDSSGVYTWVTGEVVWNRNLSTPVCLQAYCNWEGINPDNNGGLEYYVEMWAGSLFWNDIPNDDADIGQPARIGAYIVEYEPPRIP